MSRGPFVDLNGGGRYRAKEMASAAPLASASLVPQRFVALRADIRTPLLTAAFTERPLRAYYDALFAAYGPQHWWPGRTRFEIIVGAILVQNTAWTNVEPAIAKLRRAKLLRPGAIETVPFGKLARLIRSSGYFRQKAKKLKAFVRFLRKEHHGSLSKMFRTPTAALREQLLAVHGIGPETADAILLYAGERPVFVVDAYARRMLERHGLAEARHDYEYLRHFFEKNLPADAALYNEFHALIVHAGKRYCRAQNPRCSACALHSLLPENDVAST